MSVSNIINAALKRARSGEATKTAAAPDDSLESLIKEASQVADALEYMATAVIDDGTPAAEAQKAMLSEFFKGAADMPPESVAPTGTQKDVPPAGAKKILPAGQPKGDSPPELEAPTGTQATIGMPPGGKEASKPMTLLDLITKQAADSPVQSVALQDTEDPGKSHENSNVTALLDSNEAPVNATKRAAKMPTRERLKALFASASDTGPSSAAAQAAFPTAYARGGMKVADAESKKDEEKKDEDSEKESKAASIIDYATIFEKAAAGELGDEAKAFADYIESIEFEPVATDA